MNLSIVHLIKDGSFLGALSGATITGILALTINGMQTRKENKRADEKSKNVLKIMNHLSKTMISSFNRLINSADQYNAITDPEADIPMYENDEGIELPVRLPHQFEIDDYEFAVKPIISSIKKESEIIIKEFEKVNNVDIYLLNTMDLDSVLNFLTVFRANIEPKLKILVKSQRPYITNQEIDAMSRVFEGFERVTGAK